MTTTTTYPPVPLTDPDANAIVLLGLPQNLAELTEEQTDAIITYYMSLPLTELRHHQDITRKQQVTVCARAAHPEANDTRAMSNLNVQERLLTEAVMRQQFPSDV
jgi:hypothetical protein